MKAPWGKASALRPGFHSDRSWRFGRRAKTRPLKTTVTKIIYLYFHHFHRLTKNHISFLPTPMPLFLQAGNIRSRIDPPDASCWPASDCGPEANPLRLMKDRQTGLMKNSPEQSGKVIRDPA